MASRVVGSHAEQQFGNSAAARTLAYGGALTPGSLLVVTVSTFNAGITVTVSDGTNGAYAQAGAYAVSGSTRCSQWYFPNNASSGTPTVTVTPSASAYVSISIDEYLDIAQAAPVRSSATAAGSGSTITVGPAGSVAVDLVVASVSIPANGIVATSVDAPFTLLTNLAASGTVQGIYTAVDLSAPGDESCVFHLSASVVAWAAVIVAYTPLVVTALREGMVTDVFPVPKRSIVAY